MHPFDFPLLADENISAAVILGLRHRGLDVVGIVESGRQGADDPDVLDAAYGTGRVVLTHDGDFGSLAVRGGQPFVGVIYLRPGHIDANEVLRQVDAVRRLDIDATPAFLLVAMRRGDEVRVRLRRVQSDRP